MRTTIRHWIGWALAAALLSIVGSAAAITDSPLLQAVKQGNIAVARSLLNQRMDVNQTQPDGTTTLAWAAQRDDLEMAELLIRAGAKVNAANDYGATPLWIACSNGSAAMVDKLLKAGADAGVQLLS